ncbi:hypothetical protein LguiB_030524 [Lonicera macranthoides]
MLFFMKKIFIFIMLNFRGNIEEWQWGSRNYYGKVAIDKYTLSAEKTYDVIL